MSTPNLFRHAPSELSQDAFLCWLLEWADKSNEAANAALHRIARQFVQELWRCGRPGESLPEGFSTVTVKRQVDKVDIVVKIDDKSLIAIEDKVHSDEHDNQLVRYREAIQDHEEFRGRTIALVYLKTGDESRYVAAERAGYGVYPRAKLLQLLDQGRKEGVTSDIYRDYTAYLQELDAVVRSFDKTEFAKWRKDEPNANQWEKRGYAWIGFFQELQGRLDRAEWGEINNPQGLAWGLWWKGTGDLYLMLLEAELLFKVSVKEQTEQTEQEKRKEREERWQSAHEAIKKAAGELHLPVKRPARRRLGADMTVAILEGDYRATDSNGLLDLEGTLKNLKQVEDVLELTAKRLPKSPTASRE